MEATVEQTQVSAGKIGVEEDNGIEYWYAEWRDHAGRLIHKRISPSSEISRATARRRAAKIAQRMIEAHERQLDEKWNASTRDIWEATQKASFPREVVAHQVTMIVERIARSEFDGDHRGGRPGIQLFSERADISPRQVHRILEDEAYIAVGTGIVDKICTQFECIFDDFIADAFDWAEQRGEWADRPGTEDSWPFGYFSRNAVEPDDSII